MLAGSAAQVLLAWEEPDRLHRGLHGAKFTATTLSGVRRRGWAQSVGEREAGVASVSAPVRGPSGRVVAAVSISGPDRAALPPARPAARRRPSIAGANKLTEVLRPAPRASNSSRTTPDARRGRPAADAVAAGTRSPRPWTEASRLVAPTGFEPALPP